jgi:hypothetical protein
MGTPGAIAKNLPWMPQYRQAQQAMTTATGQPAPPGPTKAQKLAVLLKDGILGAMAGRAANEEAIVQSGGHRSGGAGIGFVAGLNAPAQAAATQQALQRGGLENQQLGQQVAAYPANLALSQGKTISDILKSRAEATKDTAQGSQADAEIAAMPAKTALEQAQALADRYKEDAGSGQLIDLQTQQPVNTTGQGFAPLSAQEAQILGKNEGDRVPLKVKNSANEMVNRGIKSVSAGGRQLLVDGQGRTIKDLGQATPLVTMNAQLNAPSQIPPQMQKAVDMVGKNQVDLPTAMAPFRRFPGQAEAFLGAVHDQYPDYFQGNFGATKKVQEKYTSGNVSDQLLAIGTAREHMKLFGRLADALDTGNTQLLNSIGQQIGVQFGSDKKTNFDIAAQAFGGEVGKAFDGAGVVAGERQQAQKNFQSQMSKGQFKGAVNTVDQLLAGKQKAAKDAYAVTRTGQPNFGSTPATAPAAGGAAPLPSFAQWKKAQQQAKP